MEYTDQKIYTYLSMQIMNVIQYCKKPYHFNIINLASIDIARY